MLFISRRISGTKYGVVDTDDGFEDLVEYVELNNACCQLGLDIKGIDIFNDDGVHAISSISPYQLQSARTVLQMKTLMLHHVDVTTYKDTITNIFWRQGEITSPVSLRVSDFCRKCADYILLDAEFCNEHVVTIILDDKIEFGNRSFLVFKPFFVGVEGAGAKFDLCEVSSDERATIVYNSFYACPRGIDPFNSIIDKAERKNKMREMYRFRG